MRVCGLFLLLAPFTALAGEQFRQRSDDSQFYAVRPATIECVIEAAQRQGVPVNVLLAIASVEGGRNGEAVKNHNGSFDLGHFQINSMHWSKGGVFFNNPHITKDYVRWRGCYSAELAGWILRGRLNEKSDKDFWTRAANYHNVKPHFNAVYRAKLIPAATKWGKWLMANYPNMRQVTSGLATNSTVPNYRP